MKRIKTAGDNLHPMMTPEPPNCSALPLALMHMAAKKYTGLTCQVLNFKATATARGQKHKSAKMNTHPHLRKQGIPR